LREFWDKVRGDDLATRFARIFATNLWSDETSRSGTGSNLHATRILRAELPVALRRLGASSVLDAPCGDLAWMKHVDLDGIEYHGADIVPAIIESNRLLHGGRRRFSILDLTRDELPAADVLLCRDCLVHLSFANIRKVIANVARSPIRFLFMTSFPGRAQNEDIQDGDWRPLDFEAPPFGLPHPVLTLVEKCPEGNGGYADKSLVAWSVEELR
jgi:hypothetical protein